MTILLKSGKSLDKTLDIETLDAIEMYPGRVYLFRIKSFPSVHVAIRPMVKYDFGYENPLEPFKHPNSFKADGWCVDKDDAIKCMGRPVAEGDILELVCPHIEQGEIEDVQCTNLANARFAFGKEWFCSETCMNIHKRPAVADVLAKKEAELFALDTKRQELLCEIANLKKGIMSQVQWQ